MRIINLVENTPGNTGCSTEHGLCFYIETKKHRLLMDTGASDLFLNNAEKLGVDITKVDTVILSHGHYDHGGGIVAFAQCNPSARIYVRREAFGLFYSKHTEEEERFIGLDRRIHELPGVIALEENLRIDEELFVFGEIGKLRPVPKTNQELFQKTGDCLKQDDFSHEQCLVVFQNGMSLLFSGCAHHGILNVMDRYRTLFGKDPDYVISGFHMMRKNGYTREDEQAIFETAHELKQYKSVFYTGHCTGEKPFHDMKSVLGNQLHYVHSGDEICI